MVGYSKPAPRQSPPESQGNLAFTPPQRVPRLSMESDGNCLICIISDQLNHDNGYAHDFTCHQITNHICRHSDKFRDFLLLQDDHEGVSDLESYIHNMGQNGVWGATLKYTQQLGFMALTS
jgi:hypothetical protein